MIAEYFLSSPELGMYFRFNWTIQKKTVSLCSFDAQSTVKYIHTYLSALIINKIYNNYDCKTVNMVRIPTHTLLVNTFLKMCFHIIYYIF